MKNIAILGSAGAIGSAFVKQLSEAYPRSKLYAFSRSFNAEAADNIVRQTIDYDSEASIEQAAMLASKVGPLDLVVVCIGMLHEQGIMPEKSLNEVSVEKLQRLFYVDTVIPALIAKHFVPVLNKESRAIFATLSARIGSISDNRLGGWYAYRCAKAALNMFIKTAAIETARKNPQAVVVGLHPGTVDSALSKPFQRYLPERQLFTPDYSVEQMLQVLNGLTVNDTGKCFAFDGEEINP